MFKLLQRIFATIVERPRLTLLGMGLLGLVLRVGIILMRKTYLKDFSGTDHGSIAQSIADGSGYLYQGFASSFFGPLFTYLWGGLLRFLGPDQGELVLQLLNALLLAATPLLLYTFARIYLDRGASLLAAAWLAFYPEFLILSSTVFTESVLTFLWCAVLALYALCRRESRPSLGMALSLGLVAGALLLTKGRMLPFILLLVVSLAWHTRSASAGNRRWLLVSAVVLVGMAAVVAPWTVRNQRVHGRLVLIESSAGYNLWLGHHGEATGTGKARLGVSNFSGQAASKVAFSAPPAMQQEIDAAGSEIARDDIYRHHAMKDIRARGAGELGLSLRKIAYAWILDPTNGLVRSPAYWLPWFVTLALFLLGLVGRIVTEGRRDLLLWLMLLGWTLSQIVFFVIPRLRYPIYPIIFLFAAQGLALLYDLIIRRSRGGTV